MVSERAAEVGLDAVEAEAVIHSERLVGLIAEGAAEPAAPAAGDQRDHPGLGVAIFGRGCAGRDRDFLDGIGADADLRAGRGEPEAAVAGRYRHAVHVGHRLVRSAAADRKRQRAAVVAHHDSGLEGEDVVQPIDRQLLELKSPWTRWVVVTSSRGTRGLLPPTTSIPRSTSGAASSAKS